jgi:4'-phosphopantetheinyl transferase
VLDVWHVDLSRASDEELWELLCAQELARAAQIVDAHRRALWARSRGVLRLLLARYLDGDPRALRFAYGAHGKPALCDLAQAGEGEAGVGAQARPDRTGADLRFNLSHSGALALVAVSAGREVGVDVERARERHTAAFLRAWTLREATAKCLGAGLGAPRARGPAPDMGDGVGLSEDMAAGANMDTGAGVWTAELDLGPRAFAAVALAGRRECELRRRDWPG